MGNMIDEQEINNFVDFHKNFGNTVIKYVIKINDEIVGYAFNLDSVLTSLFVKEEYRKIGIGGSIVKLAIKDDSNLSLICNKTLIAYYSKFGFNVIKNDETGVVMSISQKQ